MTVLICKDLYIYDNRYCVEIAAPLLVLTPFQWWIWHADEWYGSL